MRRDRYPLSGLILVVALQASPAAVWAQPSAPPAQPSPSAQPAPAGQPSTAPGQPAPAGQPSTPPGQPAPAGQPSGAPVEPKTADEYALEGRKLALISGRLMDARALLLTAWSMKRSYDIAGNLGSIEFELGQMRDATEHLSFCKQNFPAVRDADQSRKLAEVESLLAEARAQVGGVKIRITDADGFELQGAEVLVDTTVIGRTPLVDEVFVEPGSRVISARNPGYKEASKPIEATKGGSDNVTLVLAVLPPPPDVKGPAPVKVAPPPVYKKRMAVIAGGAGLAAAGLGLGVGFHLVSNGKGSDAQAAADRLNEQNDLGACRNPLNAATCEELGSAYDGKVLFRGVAIGGYVAGGVFAVGTLAYALLPTSMLPRVLLQQETPKTGSVRASVSVTPTGGSAVLEGTF